MLAERGVALEVIREVAGHVDVRTRQIYVEVTDRRKSDGVAALDRTAVSAVNSSLAIRA